MEKNKIITILILTFFLSLIIYRNKVKLKRLYSDTLSKINNKKDTIFLRELGKVIIKDKKRYG